MDQEAQVLQDKQRTKSELKKAKEDEEAGTGGKFLRVEGENFDIIINILIGMRRSLSNLY